MLTKTETIPATNVLEGVALWCAYYRSNPARFCEDYLHLELHLFQKIMITMMNQSTNTVFIGARGIGKTFLSAVFCVTKCILYPGTKICIASGTRGQAQMGRFCSNTKGNLYRIAGTPKAFSTTA